MDDLPVQGGLKGRKIVVLGASSGIGRAFASHAAAGGAELLLSGRREEKLREVVAETGGGTVCAADLADEASVARLAEVAERLGPFDAVISTVGAAELKLLEDMSAQDWISVLHSNVVGVNCAIRALLPALADGALVIAMSSEAVTQPRWALSAYSASKAALEVAVAGWRKEYPRLRFGTVGVGATFPTEFARTFDGGMLGQALGVWAQHGQAQESLMDSDHVGQVLAGLLGAVLPFPGVGLEHVLLRTPAPIVGTSEFMEAAAAQAAAASRTVV